MNMLLIEQKTYFATFAWDSLHEAVGVANTVKGGEVAMRRHHVSEVCTNEAHHPAVLFLIQLESKKRIKHVTVQSTTCTINVS